MACGGLKSAEKIIDARLLNRHHSVRVTDFALEIQKYVKMIFLKSGKAIEVKIGIHTGKVISGVVGETKPQFSLIGDTVNKTSRVCAKSKSSIVSVSKETLHYLELYTNNLNFHKSVVEMKGIGMEPIYAVSHGRIIQAKQLKKPVEQQKLTRQNSRIRDKKTLAAQFAKNQRQRNEDQSVQDNTSEISEDINLNSNRELMDDANKEMFDEQYQPDNESERSVDQVDGDTMNVFGFNDDLNLDDRVIIKNPTDNQIYNLVERPKYLLQFEQKEAETEFLHNLCVMEATKIRAYVFVMAMLNKEIILSHSFVQGEFTPSI